MGRRAAITEVVDDRGVTRPVRPPGNEEARAVLAEVEAQGYTRPDALPTALSLVVVVLVLVCLVIEVWRGASAWGLARLLFILGCTLLSAWFGWHMVSARIGPRYRRAILNVGRCPVCCYRLDGLERQADGVVLCPECGAAWRPKKV